MKIVCAILFMGLCLCSGAQPDIAVLKTPNAYTSDSLRTGLWTVYLKYGGLFGQGKYINNKRDGIWTYYNSSGGVMSKGAYKNGPHSNELEPKEGREGRWVHFNPQGHLIAIDYWHEGKPIDSAISFYTDSTIKELTLYRNSNTYSFRRYYRNGDIEYEGHITDGKLDGQWASYYLNKKIRWQGLFVYDSAHSCEAENAMRGGILEYGKCKVGEWASHNDRYEKAFIKKFYQGDDTYHIVESYEDGSIYLTGTITNGKPDGQWTNYYKSGQIRYQGSFEYDSRSDDLVWKDVDINDHEIFYRAKSKTGEWKEYYEDGKLQSLMTFEKGGKSYQVTTWYNNGIKEITGHVKSRHLDGPWISYRLNGTVEYEGSFDQDSSIGCEVRYLPSRWLMSNGTCKTGQWKKYYDDGKVEELSFYRHGLLHGTALRFDMNGDTLSSVAYYDGVNHGDSKHWYKDTSGHINLLDYTTYIHGVQEGKFLSRNMNGTNSGSYHLGKLQGPYKNQDPIGYITAGRYNHGHRTGKWTTYAASGHILNQAGYKNDMLVGWYLQYDDSVKKPTTSGRYKKSRPSGIWTNRYPSGELKSQGYYKKGLRSGIWKVVVLNFYQIDIGAEPLTKNFQGLHYPIDFPGIYRAYHINLSHQQPDYEVSGSYANGKTWIKGTVEDKKWFHVMVYYPSGQPYYEMRQALNEEASKIKPEEDDFRIINFWDSTGHQLLTNGNGEVLIYHNGKLTYSEKYKDGLRDGESTIYNEDKASTSISLYEKGVEKVLKFRSEKQGSNVRTFELLDDGRYVKKTKSGDGGMIMETFGYGRLDKGYISDTLVYEYQGGKKVKEYGMHNYVMDGPFTDWYTTGVKRSTGYNSAKGQQGVWMWYYEDGKIKYSITYVDGKKEGLYTEYYPDGKIKTQGNYKNDMKYGKWIRYDQGSAVPIEENYGPTSSFTDE